MDERRSISRGRALKGGKIRFHQGRPAIDCEIHNFSDGGACIEVANTAGIPANFELLFDGEIITHQCTQRWTAGNRIGVSFDAASRPAAPPDTAHGGPALVPEMPLDPAVDRDGEPPRELLQLRAALDDVPLGVVLLDQELRAQFINRAFRRMWKLPDRKADSRPAFVALMYHGRDTCAYEMPAGELGAYVAERVALVKAGHPWPMDLRLSNGEALRFQCAVLPDGGRMLSYTPVTDIVRRSDELDCLEAALDQLKDGVVVLDVALHVRYINRTARHLWKLSDADAARKPHYADLIRIGRRIGRQPPPAEDDDARIARSIALIRIDDPNPIDFHVDDRTFRARCAPLAGGGHILTFEGLSDLIRRTQRVAAE